MQAHLEESTAVDQRLAQMVLHAAWRGAFELGDLPIGQTLDMIEQENTSARFRQSHDRFMQQALLLLGSQPLDLAGPGTGRLLLRQLALHLGATHGLALVITHQIPGDGKEEGAQVVDTLATLHAHQAQERLLGQVRGHLAIAGTPGDEGLQRLSLLEKQPGELGIP